MSGRDPFLQPADPDDWFAGSAAAEGEAPDRADDWLEEPRRGRPRIPLDWNLRTILIAAAIVVVLVIAGLAIGGVFSGSKKATPPPPTTTPTTTQTPTTSKPTKTVAAPTTTLSPGDTGAQVKVLQRALTHLGYPVGKIDGDYGAATKAAVEKFQKAQGLDVDGVVGPKTLAALKQALAQS